MRKIYFTMMAVVALAITAFATDYVVSGHSRQEMNGLYVETGTSGGSPYFVKAATNGGREYAIAKQGSCWGLGEHFGNGMVMGMDMSCDQGNPPLTGWGGGITISPNGPSINYVGPSTFHENKSNDGSLSGKLTITHNKFNGEAFSGLKGDDFITKGFINVNNLPSGLVLSAVKASDDTLLLSLSGNALSHSADQTFTISFTDAALSGGGTIAGTNNTLKTFTVNFINELRVASSGADFTTIKDAIAAASSGDVIRISGETFTEAGINVDKGLTLIGEAANKTIVQAAASLSAATDRVFNANIYTNDTLEFHNMTIRYGKHTSGNGSGGGINCTSSPLTIVNCVITENAAISSGSGMVSGGGVNTYNGELKIISSLISNNYVQGGGNAYGGGIHCTKSLIINSTITNNSANGAASNSYGGGLYSNEGKVRIINSTITGNNSPTVSGICVNNGLDIKLINTIVYGNNGSKDLGNGGNNFAKLYKAENSIIGAGSASELESSSVNVSNADPLLVALADNGGVTQTYALQVGSPAIDAGASGADIPNKDQRGYGANGTRDIGAFEYNGIEPLVTGIVYLPEMMMTVYPNPNNGIFKISLSNSQFVKYTVMSLDGKLVQQKQVTDTSFEVDLSNESQGVYFLKLENSHLTKTVKIVKL